MSNNPNDTLEQAMQMLGSNESTPNHYKSGLLQSIKRFAVATANEGLELACEAKLNLIEAQKK